MLISVQPIVYKPPKPTTRDQRLSDMDTTNLRPQNCYLPAVYVELTIGFASNIVELGKCVNKGSLFPISPKAHQRPVMQPAEATFSDG